MHLPLNIGAKEYVHSKKREQEKLNFSLNANEKKKKKNGGKTEDDDDEEDQEQLDMIMKDVGRKWYFRWTWRIRWWR